MKDIIARPEEAMNITSGRVYLILHGPPTNKPVNVISEIIDGCFVKLLRNSTVKTLCFQQRVSHMMQVIAFIKCSIHCNNYLVKVTSHSGYSSFRVN